jgi:hypothetical protein
MGSYVGKQARELAFQVFGGRESQKIGFGSVEIARRPLQW